MTDWKMCLDALNAGKVDVVQVRGHHKISRSGLADKSAGLALWLRGAITFERGATIALDYMGAPLLISVGSDAKRMSGYPHFVFTGETPDQVDISISRLCEFARYTVKSSFGGEYEAWSLILSLGSNMTVENLKCSVAGLNSSRSGAMIPFVINLKATSSSARGLNNKLVGMDIENFVHGVLFSGQEALEINGVFARSRGGADWIAPGHVVYATGMGTGLDNRECSIKAIRDEGMLSRGNQNESRALGVLAVKATTASRFSQVRSTNPSGVLQSLQNCSECIFEDFYFSPRQSGVIQHAPDIHFVGNNFKNKFLRWTVNSPSRSFQLKSDRSGQVSQNTLLKFFVRGRLDDLPSAEGLIDIAGSSNDFTLDVIDSSLRKKHLLVSIRSQSSTGNKVKIVRHCSTALTRVADNGSGNTVRISSDSVSAEHRYALCRP
jgi:hypothetical protein